MRKWLLIFVGVASLVVAVALVTCKYERAREDKERAAAELTRPATISQSQSSNTAKQSCECTPKTPCWYTLLAWPEGITAWAIILTFAVIGWQADETRKAAEATQASVDTAGKSLALQEGTAKRQLRAYVCVDSSEVKFKAGDPVAKIILKNCGQTPAYELQGWTAVEIDNYLPTPPLGKPLNAGIMLCSSAVGAQGSVELEGRIARSLVEDDLNGAREGRKTIFVYGFVSYEDAFKDSRHTYFRLISGRGDLPRSIRMDNGRHMYALFPDAEGNGAT